MSNTVVLYSEEPSFFEQTGTRFSRRGVEVFCAMDVKELADVLNRTSPRLVISRGAPGGLPEPALRARLGSSPHVIVCGLPSDDPILLTSYKQSSGASVVLAPYGDALAEASASVLSVATRHFVRFLVQVKDAGDGTATFAYCQNLSTTGMLVELRRPLEVNSTVRLGFLVPGTQGMIDVNAKVVRHANSLKDVHRYGVQFLDLEPGEHDRIATLGNLKAQAGGAVSAAASAAA